MNTKQKDDYLFGEEISVMLDVFYQLSPDSRRAYLMAMKHTAASASASAIAAAAASAGSNIISIKEYLS